MGRLERGVEDKGFIFPLAAGQEPPEVFTDVADEARLYAYVLGRLGMIGDPDQAFETIKNGMVSLNAALEADRQDGDPDAILFWPIDLPDDKTAADQAFEAFDQHRQGKGKPSMGIHEHPYDAMTVAQYNRRCLAGEAAIKGWTGARALLLGGEPEDPPGLLFTGLPAAEQVSAFKILRAKHDATRQHTDLALMNIFDHLIINAASLEKDFPLLGGEVFSRTPQTGDPETGLTKDGRGRGWITRVDSIDGGNKINVASSFGYADKKVGLRVSAGLRQPLEPK